MKKTLSRFTTAMIGAVLACLMFTYVAFAGQKHTAEAPKANGFQATWAEYFYYTGAEQAKAFNK